MKFGLRSNERLVRESPGAYTLIIDNKAYEINDEGRNSAGRSWRWEAHAVGTTSLYHGKSLRRMIEAMQHVHDVKSERGNHVEDK